MENVNKGSTQICKTNIRDVYISFFNAEFS